MKKIDFKKIFKAYYSPKPGKPEIVTLPRVQFVMVDGKGDPNTAKEFQDAIGALYTTVYSLKFGRKKAGKEPDFTIGALEGLWWTKSGEIFKKGQAKEWLWTLMIWLPDFITAGDVAKQVEEAKAKKPNPALASVRLEVFEEGQAVQIMHIGPYADEQPNIELMDRYAAEKGYTQSGKHHEIYLGDPRRSAPEKLKTIIRHPIAPIKGSTA